MTNLDYFVVTYKGGEEGCPHHLSGELNHEEWEWSPYEPHPIALAVAKSYVLTLDDSARGTLAFDFYGTPSYFVSDDFLSVCSELGVEFRAIPLEIKTKDGQQQAASKHYSIFLPAQSVCLLDREQSDYQEEQDLETRGVMMNRLYPGYPMYSWIKHFVPVTSKTPPVFRCVEALDLVCTAEFVAATKREHLRVLCFTQGDCTYLS